MATRNVAQELYDLLHRSDYQAAERWRSFFIDSHPAWRHGPLPVENEQLRAMNKFWRTQIALLQDNTFDIRRYLVDDIDPNAWLSIFERHILGMVIEKQLPRTTL